MDSREDTGEYNRGIPTARVWKDYGYMLDDVQDDTVEIDETRVKTPPIRRDRLASWGWDDLHENMSPRIARNRTGSSELGSTGGCRSTSLSFVVGETARLDYSSPPRSPRFFASPDALTVDSDVYPNELELLLGRDSAPSSAGGRNRTVFSNPNRVETPSVGVPKDTIVPFDLVSGEYDYQGIPWSRFSISRPDYRSKRMREYSNYNNVNWNAQLEYKRRTEISPVKRVENNFFSFFETFKAINPTIDHFQLRHLLWSSSNSHSYYVSNSTLYAFDRFSKISRKVHATNPQQMASCHVDHGLAVSGCFDSEIKVSQQGSTDGYPMGEWKHVLTKKMSTLDNSITNHVAIVSPTTLIVANNDSFVSAVDLPSSSCQQIFKWNSAVNHVSVNPMDERLMCLSGDQCEVSLVDRRTCKAETVLHGHLDFSFCSSWGGGGSTLLCTGSQDGTCRVWDTRYPSLSVRCLGSILGAVRSAKFSNDGKWLAFSEPADFIHIYKTDTFEECQVIDFFGNVSGIAFTPDSSLFSISLADTMFGCLVDFKIASLPFNTKKNY
jgi:hypothetical protein